MDTASITTAVIRLMTEFAERTALYASDRPPVRYLWTDAFAVCNFLELFLRTGDSHFKDAALRLVDQVHHILGRHRLDDNRHGWISGLNEAEGERHPTAGGLRIGKQYQERAPQQPYDQVLEWERDGQYYHYLTKWMHALNLVARITEKPHYLDWAIELAAAAHAGFVSSSAGNSSKRMFWKMSIDLSRPQVPAMGQHDPLDGLITCLELRSPTSLPGKERSESLRKEISDLTALCRNRSWVTDDPLGLGGLLCEAFRLAQMLPGTDPAFAGPVLLAEIMQDSLDGLSAYEASDSLRIGAERRLAFRELGLAIGLEAARILAGLLPEGLPLPDSKSSVPAISDRLQAYVPLRNEINSFWLDPANRQVSNWLQHREINTVMLATSLAPACFLSLTGKRSSFAA